MWVITNFPIHCLWLILLGFWKSVEGLENSTNLNDNSTLDDQVKATNVSSLDCEHGLIFTKDFDFLSNGSLYLPQTQRLYNSDKYYIENGTVFVCGQPDEPVDNLYSYLSEDFFRCGHILIGEHEFKLLENGSALVHTHDKVYNYNEYLLQDKGLYVCMPNASESEEKIDKFSVAFNYVTFVGLTISVISLVLHLLVFCFVSKVRNLPGCCLASLSISLLLAYCFFLSTSTSIKVKYCHHIGICLYYFFLASFFWMNAIAFDVWRSFRVVVKELRISSHRVPWKRFLVYSIYSWCIPAVLAVLVHFADTTDYFPEDYRPTFSSKECWFGQRKALMIFFATPLIVVLCMNAIFFLDSSYIISMATMKTTQANEAQLRKRFFTFMRLAALMGLTWIVGIIAGYAGQEFLWYIFVILNTLQGLFIFIVFSCSSNMRSFFLKKIRRTSKKRQFTSVRTVSTISAAL